MMSQFIFTKIEFHSIYFIPLHTICILVMGTGKNYVRAVPVALMTS